MPERGREPKIVDKEPPSLEDYCLPGSPIDRWFTEHEDLIPRIDKVIDDGATVGKVWKWLADYRGFPFSRQGFEGWCARRSRRLG